MAAHDPGCGVVEFREVRWLLMRPSDPLFVTRNVNQLVRNV